MLQVNRNKRSEMKYFDLTHVFSNLICILNKMKMKMDSTRKETRYKLLKNGPHVTYYFRMFPTAHEHTKRFNTIKKGSKSTILSDLS